MKKLLEKEVEAILVKEMRLIGGRAYKWVSPGNTGVPDRIVMFPDGLIEFVEMKTEDGKLSDTQRTQIRRLRDLGHDVSVVYGVKGLCRMFEYNGFYDVAGKLRRKYGKEDWFEKGKYMFNGEKII